MKVVSIKHLAIISPKGNTYRVHFAFMTISDATKILNNCNLNYNGFWYTTST